MRLHVLMVTIAFALPSQADTVRTTELELSSDQFSTGLYGSGVFWRPQFDLDPFTVTGPGDVIDVTVTFANNDRLKVIAGAVEQESVFSFVGSQSGQRTFTNATWEFLDVQGELLLPTPLEFSSNSSGNGIATNFNPIDITDTSFSFSGVRFTFEVLDDPRITGLPATFSEGVIAVQTQGDFEIVPVPLPAAVWTALPLMCLLAVRRGFRGAP